MLSLAQHKDDTRLFEETRKTHESPTSVTSRRSWFSGTKWLTSQLFGLLSLAVLLAIIAAIPIVNLYVLGVLLRAKGEVARTGRLTAGFPLLAPARRWGYLCLGCALFLLPLSYLGSMTSDARLVNPDSQFTQRMQLFTLITASGVFLHLTLVIARGGELWMFFRPWKNLGWLIKHFRQGHDTTSTNTLIKEFVAPLQIWTHFRLGFLGAIGVLMWTVIPTTLYALAETSRGPAVLITMLGGALLTLVLCWLPILQASFADSEQFSVYTNWRTARTVFARSPCLWTLVYLTGFGLSLLLYLFKIVAPPRDALWMLTLIFILLMYPAHLFAGWVFAWSTQREQKAWWGWRWLWNLLAVTTCGFYVLLLFFTRNIGMHGKLVLYEQPFLLIPSPF